MTNNTTNIKEYPAWVLKGKEGLERTKELASKRESLVRCLTGMRPSGKLHLWHYVGALQMWKELQNIDNIDCLFLIADYHALSDNFDNPDIVKQSVRDVALDWMSVWLDPKKAHFVVQSYVPETAELTQFLQTFITKPQLDDNPTLKNEMRQISSGKKDNSDISVAFYNYPTSQAADILLPKWEIVAVGEDQIPHIEMTRRVANKINNQFRIVFPHKPFALLGEVPKLMGVDGKEKMSKSLGNAIMLSDSKEEVEAKVKKMYTDPGRLKKTDPGKLEGNVVFTYLDVFFEDASLLQDYKDRYTRGGNNAPGDMEMKIMLADTLHRLLEPIRERRKEAEENPRIVSDALEEGSAYERKIAQQTLIDLKDAMGILRY